MGIIQRHTFKGSVYSYIGAVLGFVNVAILSPRIFTTDQIGLTQVLVSIATIISQLGTLGFNNVMIRLFPYFRSENRNHRGFPFLMMLVGMTGFVLSVTIYLLFRNYFIESNLEKSELLSRYIDLLIPLLLITLAHTLFDTYNRVLYNATFGTFMKEIVVRVANFAIILLYHFNLISFELFVYGYVAILGLPPLFIFGLWLLRGEISFKPDWSIMTPVFRSEVIRVSLYGILAGFSGIALINIDKYMVNEYLGLSAAGIYSIAFYFGTLIQIPNRAMAKISTTVLAEAWKKDDRASILAFYKSSSLSQYMLGGWLFLGIVVNLDNIFQVLPPEYVSGKWVIILISIANLLNMLSGMSVNIIATSAAYKWQNWLMIIMILLVILTNMLFIPRFGMAGAAFASMLSTLTICLIRFILIWKLFGFQPYNWKYIIITLIIAGLYLLFFFIPGMALIPDLLVRSISVTILYFGMILWFRFSDEYDSLFKRITGILFKSRLK